MKYLMILPFLILSACGGSSNEYRPVGPAPFNSEFVSVTAPAILGDKITLFSAQINATQSADTIIPCDGAYGNSGSVNGVAEGNVRITGTSTKGTIQFGHTKYVGATDSRCHDISKEAYTYEIEGLDLTLCLVNPNYPYCTTYRLNLSL